MHRRSLALLLLALGACKGGDTAEAGAKDRAAESGDGVHGTAKVSDSEAPPDFTGAPGGQTPVALPGEFRDAPWLDGALKVVAYGSGDDARIVAGGLGWLRRFRPDGTLVDGIELEGAVQVLELVDLGRDGKPELLVGSGMGRGAKDATLSVVLIRLEQTLAEGREPVKAPVTSRQQVVALAQDTTRDQSFWVASFVNKFEVDVSRYEKSSGVWIAVEGRGQHRVVGDLSILGDGTPVIARFYGATADEDGGVYLLPKDAAPVQLPSTRGARAVLALDEGRVVMADGWHKEYGRKAQGFVSIVAPVKEAQEEGARGGFVRQTRAEVRDNYGFAQLRQSALHRDPGAEILASGHGQAVVVIPSRPDLLFELPGREAWDAFPIQLEGDERQEVVIAGPKPAIWTPR